MVPRVNYLISKPGLCEVREVLSSRPGQTRRQIARHDTTLLRWRTDSQTDRQSDRQTVQTVDTVQTDSTDITDRQTDRQVLDGDSHYLLTAGWTLLICPGLYLLYTLHPHQEIQSTRINTLI